jgi:hypothetical protein
MENPKPRHPLPKDVETSFDFTDVCTRIEKRAKHVLLGDVEIEEQTGCSWYFGVPTYVAYLVTPDNAAKVEKLVADFIIAMEEVL